VRREPCEAPFLANFLNSWSDWIISCKNSLALARNIWVGWDFVFPVLGSPLSGFSSFGCVILFVRREFFFFFENREFLFLHEATSIWIRN
jgi:hypothetical protein